MEFRTITPYLTIDDAQAAITFYREAFDATITAQPLTDPNGKVLHCEVQIGHSRLMLSDEFPAFGAAGPKQIGGTPVRFNLVVDDADAVVNRAEQAGAEVVIPVSDQFYGDRTGRVVDPFGHVWMISQPIEEVSSEEMQRRANELFGGGKG